MKNLKIVFILLLILVAGSNIYKTRVRDFHFDIILTQVEAMAQGENEDIVRVCTRPIAWASCYDKTGKWACMRITAVEEYKVHSVIEICDNARVTNCPKGTSSH